MGENPITVSEHLSVSIVIPVLGDIAPLRQLLDRISRLDPAPSEIICVDAGKDPECAALCAEHRCIRLNTRAGRGHQLHAGAMRASGDIAWFVHTDAEPAENAIDVIRAAVASGAIGGFFRFRFSGQTTWYKSVLAWLINQRSQVGVPYGDQGLFMHRTMYIAAGGFADEPLFEEVPLVHAARGMGQFAPVAATIGVSPRRWEHDGWLRRTLENRLLAIGYMLGIAPQRLARRYDRASNAPTSNE